jgi:uncharacterized protein (TIGR02246 family)
MKWIIALIIASVPLLAQSPADDAAIRGVVKSYIDARDRDDAKAVAALFTSDADQLVSSGEWRKGRDELVKGTLASTRSGGKRTITIETIRHIAPGVAIADGRYELAGDAQTRRMWTTFVLTRSSGNWKIAAIRNMLPAAAAPPPAK